MVETENKPKVVILGAGYAGAACAGMLQKKLGNRIHLTVIDQREASVHKVATVRGIVLGDKYSGNTLIPLNKLVTAENGQVLYEKVTEVKDEELVLASGETLPYDYLVCATGAMNFSVTEVPQNIVKRPEMKKFYKRVADVIANAKKIIIVGGGTVGVEVAGEIVENYNDKEVTIVHSGDRLLSSTQPPASKKFHRKLQKRVDAAGIKTVLGQRLLFDLESNGNRPYFLGEKEYETNKGEKLTADLVLVCTGTKLLNEVYPKEWLDEKKGSLKVRETLQILSKDNVFGIGDINDVKENKQAFSAKWQGEKAAKNIASMIDGKKKLAKYKASSRSVVIVPVGSRVGVAWFMFMTLGDSLVRKFKGRDLATKKTWKEYNLDVAKQKEEETVDEETTQELDDPLAVFYA